MFDINDLNFDSDGISEDGILAVDTDFDGIPDAVMIDTDGDGIYDIGAFDTDGDGVIDSIGINENGDEYFETFYEDVNGDGIADMIYDSDGDGLADTAIYGQYDGQFGDEYNSADTSDNGITDAYAADTDNDGVNDFFQFEVDTDNDGIADTIVRAYDYDNDGNIDTQEIYTDIDQDGVFDVFTKAVDTDGDGDLDAFKTYYDYDGDGQADTIIEERFVDTDGDGIDDSYVVRYDENANGVYETTEVYGIDSETGTMELLAYETDYEDFYSNQYGNFDPDGVEPGEISGDPARSMEEWEYQGDTNRCALYSQKFVIEELTGQEIDIEEIADLAEENGWFSEEGGTPFLNMNKVLEYYGVENNMSFNNDINDIVECLDSGGRVIVSVDSGEIWIGESNDLFDPNDGADHAVEVIGVDYSDPNHPMVVLNDSGHPEGCGELVPLDVFVDAWEDGNCQMIACM